MRNVGEGLVGSVVDAPPNNPRVAPTLLAAESAEYNDGDGDDDCDCLDDNGDEHENIKP
jgi:hypothetical protein